MGTDYIAKCQLQSVLSPADKIFPLHLSDRQKNVREYRNLLAPILYRNLEHFAPTDVEK